MRDNKIYNIWKEFISDEKYKKYFLTIKDVWYASFNKAKDYIDKNNKKPSVKNKNKNIQYLGSWISSQQRKYLARKQIMIDEIIYKTWNEFVNNVKYKKFFVSNYDIWYEMFNKLKVYITENKKRPSQSDTNKNTKLIGDWLAHQIQNYKCNIDIMKDKNMREIWKKFTCVEYKEYFMSYIDKWYIMLKKVKDHIDEHDMRPSPKSNDEYEKSLGYWFVG